MDELIYILKIILMYETAKIISVKTFKKMRE